MPDLSERLWSWLHGMAAWETGSRTENSSKSLKEVHSDGSIIRPNILAFSRKEASPMETSESSCLVSAESHSVAR